jgi:hypothetical protein
MNENLQNNSSTNPAEQPQNGDRFSRRQARREARRSGEGSLSRGTWVGGAILIGLGIVLMLQNTGTILLNNWWALFILLPAAGAFGNAWRTYQSSGGHLTAPARASFIGGIAFTLVAAIFLFNLNWTILGPVLIILVGIGIFINAILPG